MFVDTHAHLCYPDFAEELPQVIGRAEAAKVTGAHAARSNIEAIKDAELVMMKIRNGDATEAERLDCGKYWRQQIRAHLTEGESIASMLSIPTARQDQYGLPVADVHFDDHSNDTAMRVVQAATGRSRFISFIGSWHGGLSGSSSISGHSAFTHTLSRPGLLLIPYPDPYRSTFTAPQRRQSTRRNAYTASDPTSAPTTRPIPSSRTSSSTKSATP